MTKKEYIERYEEFRRNSNVAAFIRKILPENTVYHPDVSFQYGVPSITFDVYKVPGDLAKISQDKNDPARVAEHNIRWYAPAVSLSVPSKFGLDDESDEDLRSVARFEVSFSGHGVTGKDQDLVIALYREAFDVVDSLNRELDTIWSLCAELNPVEYHKRMGGIPANLIEDKSQVAEELQKHGINPKNIPISEVRRAFGSTSYYADAAEEIMSYINLNQESGDLSKEVDSLLAKYPGLKEQLVY